MVSTIATAMARLRGHRVQFDIAKRKLRDMARCLEKLSEMSRHNADSATRAAMGSEGPPTPEYSRLETWADRPLLLERSAAIGELGSAIRCELASVRRRK
jgi:hypothetical protein